MRNKGLHFILTAVAMLLTAGVQGQVYQLPNGGFESWDGSSNTAEPSHWNSFATSDGTYSGMASSPHHYHRYGGRPGTTGNSYLTIYTKSIIGIKANGNMTTGRIHAGSTTASSDKNYNYTRRSDADFCQPFTATPDSLYVWVSFYASSADSKAQISAIIHGDSDFKAPNEENTPSMYAGRAKIQFVRTTSSKTSMSWQQLKVPFVYNGNASPHYLLLSMTTNYEPGSGNANDSLSVDDIEFIYSAWLRGIAVGGNEITSFERGRLNYTVHVDNREALDTISVEPYCQVADATPVVTRELQSDTTALVSITVTAEDGVTVRNYSVLLTTDAVSPTDPLSITSTETKTIPIFPNPTTDLVNIDYEGEIQIADLQGRMIISRTCHGQETIDLSTLPQGIYLLLTGNKKQKIVKR